MLNEKQKDTAEKGINIIVNGRQKTVFEKELSFDQIVKIAYENPPTGPDVVFTVNYRAGRGQVEQSLVRGKNVEVTKGLVINVGITDKS